MIKNKKFKEENIDVSISSPESANEQKAEALIVDIDGYEGPLDALLFLARTQKVDLAKISILQLAEQYLAFIHQAHDLKLEIAADYLVMAAWLAYMKSRLLIPDAEPDEEPSGPEMAEALANRLLRLNAMRNASKLLFERPQNGYEVFSRGGSSDLQTIRVPYFQATLFDILQAYISQDARVNADTLIITPQNIYSMVDAYKLLSSAIGSFPSWELLSSFLPEFEGDDVLARSAVASTFAASLELVREGKIQIRQNKPFAPIYLKGNK